jgi:signal transduction histidine kinase
MSFESKIIAGIAIAVGVLVLNEIRARRRAEKALVEQLERAEAASRAKDEFVAMVSHELRTPLTAILGWTQMLRAGKFDQAATKRALETMERNARAQAQLIDDLLDISRIISGKLTLDLRPVDLRQAASDAIDAVRPSIEAKGIHLEVDLGPGGAFVLGDPNRLQQIAWNLLSNAAKFTPRHGKIEVRLQRMDSYLSLSVSDSGAGIGSDFLPYIFNRFSQESTANDPKLGGLGLGLSIARHLVEAHGGSIQAASPGLGQGATFTLMLPISTVYEVAGEAASSQKARSAAEGGPGGLGMD